jgi:hypothetical protein
VLVRRRIENTVLRSQNDFMDESKGLNKEKFFLFLHGFFGGLRLLMREPESHKKF